MPFLFLIALSLLALLIASACFYLFRHLPSRHRRRPRKFCFGFYPAAAGTALQTIQAILRPSAQIVIEAICDEHNEEDDASDPNHPLQHLPRQAARIRRGEPLDRFTALLPSRPSTPAQPS